MIINRLNARKVAKAGPGMHADGGGLYLQVTPSVNPNNQPARSWIFRYAVGTKERKMGIGPIATISLVEAREKAKLYRQQRLDGVDPITHRDAQRTQRKVETAKAMTFEQCAKEYIETHSAGWRNAKHEDQWSKTIKAYVNPVFGDQPVGVIDTSLVTKALDKIWTTKTETASRVRSRIELILDWAVVKGLRMPGANPARWKGHLDKLYSKKTKVVMVKHHPALPYSEIGSFMAQLRAIDGAVARALEFTILTASRTGESLGARWEEVDLTAKSWTVPAERMKGGIEHRVALNDRAVAILKQRQKVCTSGLIFPGDRRGRPFSDGVLLKLLRTMELPSNPTVHGFRSTFSDWAKETTSHPPFVVEAALAHKNADKVEAAYSRGDLFQKRHVLMRDWSKACERVPATVTSIHNEVEAGVS
jgi:integrase